MNWLTMGRQMRDEGIAAAQRVDSRTDLFDLALTLLNEVQTPLYLEFGVWEGESFRYIADHLSNPRARLVGFDSFEGLPEEWHAGGIGTEFFSTGGATPNIDDERASWVAGWFNETLPDYEVPAHDRLLINVDCDLYSSARTVLTWAADHLQVGDLIYFDEFGYRFSEFRAFTEFLDESGQRYEMLAATRGTVQALLRRIA